MMTPSQLLKSSIKWPLRAVAARLGAHQRGGEPRLWIMMYHRVLPQSDPRFAAEEPGMVVTPETLRMHLAYLASQFEIVSLSDWITRATAGDDLPRKACAITFDDGWHDNYEFAYPILTMFSAPATIFTVSHMIGTRARFWPNRLVALLQALPPQWQQSASLAWLQQLAPALSDSTQLTPEIAADVISRAKAFSDTRMHDWLDSAEQTIPVSAAIPDLMDWEQVRSLCREGLIEIGSHTCHHTRLNSALDEPATQREICESKSEITAQLGTDVSLFCYPNGDTSDTAEALVRREYRGAVTTRTGINNGNSDMFRLARISLHNDNSDTLLKLKSRLACWPYI